MESQGLSEESLICMYLHTWGGGAFKPVFYFLIISNMYPSIE